MHSNKKHVQKLPGAKEANAFYLFPEILQFMSVFAMWDIRGTVSPVNWKLIAKINQVFAVKMPNAY